MKCTPDHNTSGLISVATATSGDQYTQSDILNHFNITDKKINKIFHHSHIKTRYLTLPEKNKDQKFIPESQEELLEKHKKTAITAGRLAIQRVLQKSDLCSKDIDYIAVCSTTGLLSPGLTAYFTESLSLRADIHRLDVVGMGCHAGLNTMQSVSDFCALHPDAVGLLVCVEICSAMYVIDDTMNTAVVNSLFGDGAAATIISQKTLPPVAPVAKLLAFSSYMIPQTLSAMKIRLQDNKFCFYLDKDIPYVIGNHVKKPIDQLLSRFALKTRDIHHWVIHSGGKKVIDAIKYALNISEYDVRHTVSALQDYGNISSGSFLFSYERLLQEKLIQRGEFMVMMTMGPGATIECCLGVF